MLLENLKDYIKGYKKGTYASIAWKKTVTNKRSKELGYTVERIYSGSIRIGINSKNTKYYKTHYVPSTSDTVKRPSWFHHTEIREIVEHNENGRLYLQCFSSSKKLKSTWLLNGRVISIEHLLANGFINRSDVSNNEMYTTTVPVDEIISITQTKKLK